MPTTTSPNPSPWQPPLPPVRPPRVPDRLEDTRFAGPHEAAALRAEITGAVHTARRPSRCRPCAAVTRLVWR